MFTVHCSLSSVKQHYVKKNIAVAKSCLTLCDLMDCLQAPLSMGFPRKEYWSGLPISSPGDPTDPGIKPVFPALAGEFFTTEPPRKPWWQNTLLLKYSIHFFFD